MNSSARARVAQSSQTILPLRPTNLQPGFRSRRESRRAFRGVVGRIGHDGRQCHGGRRRRVNGRRSSGSLDIGRGGVRRRRRRRAAEPQIEASLVAIRLVVGRVDHAAQRVVQVRLQAAGGVLSGVRERHPHLVQALQPFARRVELVREPVPVAVHFVRELGVWAVSRRRRIGEVVWSREPILQTRSHPHCNAAQQHDRQGCFSRDLQLGTAPP
jgi:hypothetical protein